MGKIDHHLAFVKEQVQVQEKLAKKYDEEYRQNMHLKAARNFADLARFLEEIQNKGTAHTGYLNRGNAPQKRLFLTFEEIEEAPEELLKELNISETDKQDLLIEYIIAEQGGILSLDKIMFELYSRTKEVSKRAAITNRLYRMSGRGMIYNVPGKKGVYSTYELSEQEAKKMFGQFDEAPEEPALPTAPTAAPPPRSTTSAPSGVTPSPTEGRDRLKTKLMSGTSTSHANRT
ncbi:hypothetical protein SAMN05519104_6646 [Rhizobiales bacterium GAS188]|nr:hypothetical protein SAMN05519104_6646 [Rhizobiales bacterium GAS188]